MGLILLLDNKRHLDLRFDLPGSLVGIVSMQQLKKSSFASLLLGSFRLKIQTSSFCSLLLGIEKLKI